MPCLYTSKTATEKGEDVYQEWPSGLSVCFVEGNQQVGKQLMYKDPDRLFESHQPVAPLFLLSGYKPIYKSSLNPEAAL
jgi:hypothetical protein